MKLSQTKQEPEETIRAAHQVLFPGRGSQRTPFPSVSRRHSQRQRPVVGPASRPAGPSWSPASKPAGPSWSPASRVILCPDSPDSS
ncbi:hypothetical protein EYF80_019168 [Liparis tanakae]|uniref:Uncharacterized protein n=1 Tax=Liparis tanakae TaxID=230148 RepID=A0A4Z2HZY2_9TELE|nr:hypothetical protein EYF80_019168 [Liparis tanakae]